MGIYQKLKIRGLAIHVVDFITWVRQYGFKDGGNIFRGLKNKNKDGYYQISCSFFKNPVLLRDNFSDKAIFNQVFYEQQYRNFDIEMENVSRIIDAGANIGLASVYFSKIYPQANILSIEPEGENFKMLQKNTSAYKNIHCLHAAIWNKDEMISIANPDSLAASFMVEEKSNGLIPAKSINTLLTENGWDGVDILKLDIEGAEKEVFSSDVSWLNKTRLLIIELHDRFKPDCTKTVFKALEKFDYQAFFHHENIFILFNR